MSINYCIGIVNQKVAVRQRRARTCCNVASCKVKLIRQNLIIFWIVKPCFKQSATLTTFKLFYFHFCSSFMVLLNENKSISLRLYSNKYSQIKKIQSMLFLLVSFVYPSYEKELFVSKFISFADFISFLLMHKSINVFLISNLSSSLIPK